MSRGAGTSTEPVRLALHAMATRFEIVLGGDDPVRSRAAGEEALAEIATCEATLSAFRPGSLVSRINRLAAARPVAVDVDTFELLEAACAIHDESGGAFDVTVGAAMRALGFRGEASPDGATGRLLLDRAARTVRFDHPGLELDLGGIAKGHALDRAAAVLRDHGVDSALLHGGTSTAVAIGGPPGAAHWRIALGPWPDSPTVALRDAALAVSAPHGKSVIVGGALRTHVLDPRTRASAAAGIAAAAVVSDSALRADAWSTALVVLGTDATIPRDLAVHLALPAEDDAVRWLARAPAGLS